MTDAALISGQNEDVPTDVRRLVDKIMDDAIAAGSDLSTEQLMALAVIADRERRTRKALALILSDFHNKAAQCAIEGATGERKQTPRPMKGQ